MGAHCTYGLCRLNIDGEEGVTAGGCVVHRCLAHLAQAVSLVHNLLDFCDRLHCEDSEIFHEDALLRVLFQVELGVRVGAKQVSNFFVVDFNVGATDEELFVKVGLIVDATVDVLEGVGDDALILLISQSHHCVRLSTAGLPVGKNRAVIAPNDRLNQGEGCFVVNLPLRRIRSVNSVIGENFFFWPSFLVGTHNHLVCRLVDIANTVAAWRAKK